MQSGPSFSIAGDYACSFPCDADVSLGYKPSSMLHQPSLAPFPMNHGWAGVGGFASPAQPAPPLCAPPLTIASSLGNPLMPASSTYNTNSSMDFNFRLASTHMAPAFKRKAMEEEDMDDRMRVTKQLITEDKVSASLKSLHLSNEFTTHQLGADVPKSLEKPLVKDGSDDSDSDGGHLPRLYVSKDIDKIPVDNRNSLPETLLKNLKRDGPCLEVVLWQPPTPLVSTLSTARSSEDNEPNAGKDGGSNAEASVPSVGAQSLFGNASNSETAVNSPDSGVSISPPSNSISLDLPCEMEEDASAAGLSSSSTPTAATFQQSSTSFSGNPFSLFYPSHLNSPVPATLNASTVHPSHDVAQPSPVPKHYANSASAAYTRAWLEQNNNVVVAAPAVAAPAPLPPLPSAADDDMDL